MFEREIEKNLTVIDFRDKLDFDTFVEDLEDNTQWLEEKAGNLQVKYAKAASGVTLYGVWDLTSPLAKSAFEGTGGYYLEISGANTRRIPINAETAPFTIDDRAGVRSKLLADYFGKGHPEAYTGLVNDGLHFYNETIKILVRGGQVHAMHTKKYCTMPQKEIFEIAESLMTKYPSGDFVSGQFATERTYAKYEVCDNEDTFFERYSKAWIDAGLPEKMLEQSRPVLTFSTGDTGKYPVAITPQLQIGSAVFPLGTTITVKHTKSLTAKQVEESATLAFSNLQKGLTSVEEMLQIQLKHPYAVFVKAASKTGITTKAKGAITAVLENFKDNFIQDVDDITAFDVYYSICEIQHYDEYSELKSATKLQVMEALNRLIQIDWEAIDLAGREEF